MIIQPVKLDEKIKDFIKECYKQDIDIHLYHREPNVPVDAIIEVDFDALVENQTQMYDITLEGKKIAHIGLIDNNKCLHTFLVLPEYRNKEILKQVSNIILRLLDKDNKYCVLYSRNTRAINFVKKTGFKSSIESNVNNYDITILS